MSIAKSYQLELLDQDNIPFEDILLNMQELNTINTILGGHAITVKGFKQLLAGRKKISVCEIGCGGGDNLVAIQQYCAKNNIDVQLIGVDIKLACIEVAQQNSALQSNTYLICSDYSMVEFETKPDIIFSSLFCHHFNNDQLVGQLKWMSDNSKIGFFINDLHRHWLAHFSIKWLTKLFSNSYLVKNDAPLSVLRGFLQSEWKQLFNAAGLHSTQISWQWAFRHLIVYHQSTLPNE
ncbi:MAG: methyltransferase domain-containing protein [Sphingobacteriia bacterium]|jgi:2-polyprenyl-3-methyl-5-hydroxy-6-metoxy-1,4-benzoquinol methylase